MEFSGGFSGFIIIKGETQFNISVILDKIYFNYDFTFKYNKVLKNYKNSKINPLIIKVYENGEFRGHSFIFENKLLDFINHQGFNITDYNLSECIKHLRLNPKVLGESYRENCFKYFYNNIPMPPGYHKLLKDFNFWDLNIYNEEFILRNSILTKKQSENIILNIKKLENYKSIPQNTFILNNIIKQYNLIHNKNT